jgi:hypothetical protein
MGFSSDVPLAGWGSDLSAPPPTPSKRLRILWSPHTLEWCDNQGFKILQNSSKFGRFDQVQILQSSQFSMNLPKLVEKSAKFSLKIWIRKDMNFGCPPKIWTLGTTKLHLFLCEKARRGPCQIWPLPVIATGQTLMDPNHLYLEQLTSKKKEKMDKEEGNERTKLSSRLMAVQSWLGNSPLPSAPYCRTHTDTSPSRYSMQHRSSFAA